MGKFGSFLQDCSHHPGRAYPPAEHRSKSGVNSILSRQFYIVADCASQGMFPFDCLHTICGVKVQAGSNWASINGPSYPPNPSSEDNEMCSRAAVVSTSLLFLLGQYSQLLSCDFMDTYNCRAACPDPRYTGPLSVEEMSASRVLWLSTCGVYHTKPDRQLQSGKSMKLVICYCGVFGEIVSWNVPVSKETEFIVTMSVQLRKHGIIPLNLHLPHVLQEDLELGFHYNRRDPTNDIKGHCYV